MRDPNRLDKFYEEVKKIHKYYVPDQRFGQFCSNFFGWLATEKKMDLFFPEDDRMLEYMREYFINHSPYHKPWELDGGEL